MSALVVGGRGATRQVNKFEHVCSLGYQMPLPGGRTRAVEPCTEGLGPGRSLYIRAGMDLGSLCGEVQCIMGNGQMGPPPPVNRQTHTTENITFVQLRWRAVINEFKEFQGLLLEQFFFQTVE